MKRYLSYLEEMKGLEAVGETVQVIEKTAASHIHRLKVRVSALSNYKQSVEQTLRRLSHFYWDESHVLLQSRRDGPRALLVLSGSKGIVGGLYHGVVNRLLASSDDYEYIWVAGSKGVEYISQEGIEIEDVTEDLFSEDVPTRLKIAQMGSELSDRFTSRGMQKIDVLYPRFITLTRQEPDIVQFLPFELSFKDNDNESEIDDGFPVFEPGKKQLFDDLVKKYSDISFAELILEAKLSEFAARTVTAESAAKETEALMDKLSRKLTKERHRNISQRQLESFSVHKML